MVGDAVFALAVFALAWAGMLLELLLLALLLLLGSLLPLPCFAQQEKQKHNSQRYPFSPDWRCEYLSARSPLVPLLPTYLT